MSSMTCWMTFISSISCVRLLTFSLNFMTSLLFSLILLICLFRSVIHSESFIRAFWFYSKLLSCKLLKNIMSSVKSQITLFRTFITVILVTVFKFSWFEAFMLKDNLSCHMILNDWLSAIDELFLCCCKTKTYISETHETVLIQLHLQSSWKY